MTTHDNFICLDLGSSVTGWAYFSLGVLRESGVLKFKTRVIKKIKQPRAVRYLQFAEALENSLTDDSVFGCVAPKLIVYELCRGNWINASAPEAYHAMLALLEIHAYKHNIELFPVTQTTLKKIGTGKGNAKKELIMESAALRWPDVDIQTHDQADAMLLGDCYFRRDEWYGKKKKKKKKKTSSKHK